MTPRELLALVGEALYGPRWQSDLARALGVSDRTMRRWAAGTDAPRPGVMADLVQHIRARQASLRVLEEQIAMAVPAA